MEEGVQMERKRGEEKNGSSRKTVRNLSQIVILRMKITKTMPPVEFFTCVRYDVLIFFIMECFLLFIVCSSQNTEPRSQNLKPRRNASSL